MEVEAVVVLRFCAFQEKDWLNVSSELAQDHRAWEASVPNVVNPIGETG